MDRARWQAKMASIEFGIPWRNVHRHHFTNRHFMLFPFKSVFCTFCNIVCSLELFPFPTRRSPTVWTRWKNMFFLLIFCQKPSTFFFFFFFFLSPLSRCNDSFISHLRVRLSAQKLSFSLMWCCRVFSRRERPENVREMFKKVCEAECPINKIRFSKIFFST